MEASAASGGISVRRHPVAAWRIVLRVAPHRHLHPSEMSAIRVLMHVATVVTRFVSPRIKHVSRAAGYHVFSVLILVRSVTGRNVHAEESLSVRVFRIRILQKSNRVRQSLIFRASAALSSFTVPMILNALRDKPASAVCVVAGVSQMQIVRQASSAPTVSARDNSAQRPISVPLVRSVQMVNVLRSPHPIHHSSHLPAPAMNAAKVVRITAVQSEKSVLRCRIFRVSNVSPVPLHPLHPLSQKNHH